jgi:hypothetical protein
VAGLRGAGGCMSVPPSNLRRHRPEEASVIRFRRASRRPQHLKVPDGRRQPRGNLQVDCDYGERILVSLQSGLPHSLRHTNRSEARTQLARDGVENLSSRHDV